MVMEQIANLSTGNCRQGSSPCLSAKNKLTTVNQFWCITQKCVTVRSPVCKANGVVIAPRLGRGGRHARSVTTQKEISFNGIIFISNLISIVKIFR